MAAELEIWLIYGLTATGIVFLSLFAVNLACAPYRLERDAHNKSKGEIEALRAQIPRGPAPRRLSHEQKSMLSDALRAAQVRPPKFNVLYSNSSEESVDFAADIGDAIRAAGLECSVHDGVMYKADVRDRGLKLLHGKSPVLRDFAGQIQEAMKSVGHFVERRELDERRDAIFFYVARASETQDGNS